MVKYHTVLHGIFKRAVLDRVIAFNPCEGHRPAQGRRQAAADHHPRRVRSAARRHPGLLPGRPLTPAQLGVRLRRLGMYAIAGRRATLSQLAAELPAAVLADLLHLAPTTAVRWVRDAGGDWSRYAAELARDHGHN